MWCSLRSRGPWTAHTGGCCGTCRSGRSLRAGSMSSTSPRHLPPSAWEPWHHAFTDQFAAAGFTPRVVAYDSNPQTLLALVAAGIGVTRLARPAQDLRGSGVVFVPLANQFTTTEIVWLPTNTNPALARLIDIVTTLAATTDLTTTRLGGACRGATESTTHQLRQDGAAAGRATHDCNWRRITGALSDVAAPHGQALSVPSSSSMPITWATPNISAWRRLSSIPPYSPPKRG